jgi:hypothetical protein
MKRRRSDGGGAAACTADRAARTPQLRFCAELATLLGTRYCKEEDLLPLILSRGLITRVSTFQVKATQMGDLNEWMSIILDDEHASTADVKEGVEREKGIRPAMQEIFSYDESWTGTKASGGSGHSDAQEDAALLEDGFKFEGPCSVLVSVNETYDLVLEGLVEGEAGVEFMGVYERVDGLGQVSGKDVWMALGGIERYLYHDGEQWWCGDQEEFDKVNSGHPGGHGILTVVSFAGTPDQITEVWQANDPPSGGWPLAPKLRARACNSAEKLRAERQMHQDEARASAAAQEAKRLSVQGLAFDEVGVSGVYQLLEGKVVNRRPVWKKHERGTDRYLFYTSSNEWYVSDREDMVRGCTSQNSALATLCIVTKALTPDHLRPTEVWLEYDGQGAFVDAPNVRVTRVQR